MSTFSATRRTEPRVAEAARGRVLRGGRLWQFVWIMFMAEYWAANWLKPAGRGVDAIQLGQWRAPHIFLSLAVWGLVGVYLSFQFLRYRIQPLRVLLRSKSVSLFAGYVLMTLLSWLYSTYPALSLAWATKWILAVGLMVVYVHRFHPVLCWRPAISATVGTLLVAQIMAIALAMISEEQLFLTRGDVLARLATIDHPVTLGLVAAIFVLLISFWPPEGQSSRFIGAPIKWTGMAVGAAIIGLTLSRSGLFTLLIAGATALMVARRKLPVALGLLYPPLIILPLVGLLGGADALGGLVDRYVYRYDPQETYSLTGRFEVWGVAVDLIRRSPLLGYGFVAAARTELAPSLPRFFPGHAHNAWLQATLDVGLIGAGLLAASAVGFLRLAIRGLRAPVGVNAQGRPCGCDVAGSVLIIALMTVSFVESAFAGIPTTVGLLWLLGGSIMGFGRRCVAAGEVSSV
jgi:O-antigen ligase